MIKTPLTDLIARLFLGFDDAERRTDAASAGSPEPWLLLEEQEQRRGVR